MSTLMRLFTVLMFVFAAQIGTAQTNTTIPASTATTPSTPKAVRTAPKSVAYDHLKTGYELLGYHRQVKCDECHIKGVFRGTPRECVTCHSIGSRFLTATTMSAKHFQVGSKICSDCHVTSDWYSVNVRHDSAMAGKCLSCHDGIHASGEPSNHFPTQQASCDYCHSTVSWLKPFFDHAALVKVSGSGSGATSSPRCDSCHNGSKAQGMGTKHIPTSGADCVSCHGNPPAVGITLGNYASTWASTGTFDHNFPAYAAAVANCSYCHDGVLEVGKGTGNPPHISTSAECKLCHKTTSNTKNNGLGFAGGLMDHTGITSGCTSCHFGQTFQGLTTRVDHGSGVASTPAGSLVTRVSNHFATKLACETCHKSTSIFSGTTMNHQGITTGCSSCHAASPAAGTNVQYNTVTMPELGKSTHIATSQAGDKCETCHSVVTPGGFATATMSHTGISVSGSCVGCHESTVSFAGLSNVTASPGSATQLVVRPGARTVSGYDHPTTGECSGCHNSFTSFTVAIAGKGMPNGHFPTTQACTLCHATGYGLGTTVMNHTGSSTVCGTCHGVSFTTTINGATGSTFTPVATATSGVVHMSTSGADCGTCHTRPAPTGTVTSATPSYAVGTGFKVISYVANLHAYISTTACAGCHDTGATAFTGMAKVQTIAAAVGSITTTPTTIAGCATANGSAHGALGECVNCHTAAKIAVPSTASTGFCSVGLPAGHFATTQSCTLCHAGGFTPGKSVMSHSGITTGCTTCHNGQTFLGLRTLVDHGPAAAGSLVTKVAGHFATTLACETCHKSTSVFSATAMNHQGITTGCSTCHLPNTATGPTVQYNTVTMAALALGAHIPTSQVGDKCETCHSIATPGGFATAAMLHTGIGVGGSCVGCHESTVSFAGMSNVTASPGSATKLVVRPGARTVTGYDHPMTGECSGCHNSFTSFTVAIAGKGMPTGHFPTTQACTLCHATGYGLGTTVMNHSGASAVCATCHGVSFTTTINGATGTTFTPVGTATAGVTHMATSGTDCVTCHTRPAPTATVTSATPTYAAGTGFKVLSYIANLHAYVGTSTCAGCHDTAAPTFTGMSSKIKTIAAAVGSITIAPDTVAGCSTSNGSTHGALGECVSCHTTAKIAVPSTATTGFCAAGLPAGHFATAQACTLCHTAGYALGKSVMNHAGITTCNSCHNGATLSFGAVTVKPVSTASVSHYSLTGGDCSNCHTAAIPTVTVSSATPAYSVGAGFKVTSYVSNLHSYVSTAACATCHDSSTATTYSGITSAIQTIGALASAGQITVAPTTVAGCATGVGTTHGNLGECASCHMASAIAVPSAPSTGFCAATSIMPVGHIVTTGSCTTSCHSAGYALGLTKMDHTQAPGTCISCHGATAITFPAGAGTTPAYMGSNGIHVTLTDNNCNNSGCHAAPLGTQTITSSTLYQNGFHITAAQPLNHTYVSATCQNCHASTSAATYNNGAVTMVRQPSNHIPNPGGAGCTVCHTGAVMPNPAKGSFPLTSSFMMNHGGIASSCNTCHQSSGLYAMGSLTLIVRPTGNIIGCSTGNGVLHAAAPLDCAACHASKTGPTSGSTGFCSATSMPANHVPTTGPGWTTPPACAACHASGTGVGSGVMNHAGASTAVGGCNACHGATSPIPFYGVTPMWAGQLGTHVPFGQYGIPAAAAISCRTCHTTAGTGVGPVGGFAAGSKLLHSHVTVTAGSCVPCHLSPGTILAGPEKITKKAVGHQNGSQSISTSPTMPSCDVCHSHTTSGFP
jgi:hypothetical protein